MNQRDKIAILGFGVEGRAVFDYLLKEDFTEITICDENVDLDAELPDGISARLGPHYLDDLSEFDVIFRSPGIRVLHPSIQLAKNAGATVTSATVLFVDQCPCPIIGVTGTKGKGTTSTLIHEILKEAGMDARIGGNIGYPAIEFLDELKSDSLVVLEMSSFQLQDMEKSPRYSIFLNTTSDHLDYHVDKDEYMLAKEALLAHQKEDHLAILNQDYEYFQYYKPLVKGDLLKVSLKEKVRDGGYLKDGKLYYVKGGESEEVVKVEDVALVGSHNLENVLPAMVICKELGVANKHIVKVVKDFKGLPHRLEFVGEVDGVKYYDDSNATSPNPSMAAVDSFEEPTVLIAGGSSKGEDYSEWAVKILTKPNLHCVVLMGATADRMEEELRDAEKKLGEAEGSPTKIVRRKEFAEVVEAAAEEAEEGGVVVLSPAAASFDMFKNYKDRGNQFAALVNELGK